ncbi:MAG TPA: hypothetical protein VFS67_26315 [Polyangiaceae bacterium]|nr:hypothetical protein [Polyangiaceae bacterium]
MKRARALACCAIALACGVSLVSVWRQRGLASAATESRAALRTPIAADGAAPAPRASTRVAAPPRPPTAVRPASLSAAEFEEPELMRQLRRARGNDPALAIELAREGNRRFPGSPAAPERASILIHALAERGLASEARGEAEDMVNRYPDSAWVREVERFTGARRHRNLQVGPDGELHYVDPPAPTRG